MTDVSLPRAMLESLGPLPDGALGALAQHIRPRQLSRGAFFARAGEEAHEVAFVCSGILRMFYVRDDGREFNKSFLGAGDFCAVLDSLVLERPSRLFVDVLSTAELLVLPWAELVALYDHHLHWARVGRRVAETLAVKKMRREASLLLDSAEERYRAFREDHAAMEREIPDYHIASYIGVTPEALSRIKKRIALRPH